jgi:hypothetical protein
MSAYRLKSGHVTKAALLADAASVVTSFTGATSYAQWLVAEPLLITPYARRPRLLNGQVKAIGTLTFTWTLGILTDAMYDHLYTTILGGAMSGNVTVLTRNRLASTTPANQWVAVQAIMTLPELTREGLNPRIGTYYSPFVVTFSDGAYAPDS